MDTRSLLKPGSAAEVDGITAGMAAARVQGGERKDENPPPKGVPRGEGKVKAKNTGFAQVIGVIFR